MAEIQIDGLPEAVQLFETDKLHIKQGIVDKQINASDFIEGLAGFLINLTHDTATFSAGSSSYVLPFLVTEDTNVDVYVGNVWQSTAVWSISSGNLVFGENTPATVHVKYAKLSGV